MGLLPMDFDILPPSDDRVFKLILTSPDATPVLANLISAILGRTVSSVVVRNNELPPEDTEAKAECFDVNCVLDDGTQTDLEMQARETVNEVIASKEALQMAGDLLMSISKDERERAVFRSRRMYQTDLASDLATAEDRGERRGIEIGERRGIEIGERRGIKIGERRGIEIGERRGAERGERNRSFEVARRMLRRNRPVDEIAEITDLSVEDVEGLKAEEHERE